MTARASSPLADALAIARYHIVLIAMAACVVFGWLMTGRYAWLVALVVGLDWFLINLLNRVTDLEEDRKNAIPGTDRVARFERALTIGSWALMIGSFVATHLAWPELTTWRALVQVIGLAYNYRVVPTPSGMSRLKEIYFFKNFGSSMLFTLTGFVYPLAVLGDPSSLGWAGVVVLALFFVAFELTYEILYDFRDLEGDRALGIPTYPVVHGELGARRIVDGLLVGSALVLIAGLATGAIGVREGLMLAAPPIQLAFYRPRLARGLTTRDCIVLTHLGTALLVFYLAGTAIWSAAGLSQNIYLAAPLAE